MWEFKWRRNLLPRDISSLDLLMTAFNRNKPSKDEADRWKWEHSSNGVYQCNIAYKLLMQQAHPTSSVATRKKTFFNLWYCFAPRRAKAVIWKMLKGRLATKDNLIIRGLSHVVGSPTCKLCDSDDESLVHLFFHCSFARELWSRFYQWTRTTIAAQDTSIGHLLQHIAIFGFDKTKRKIVDTLWCGLTWSIWNVRNNFIFNGEAPNISKTWEEYKARTWSWLSVHVQVIRECQVRPWLDNPRLVCDSVR